MEVLKAQIAAAERYADINTGGLFALVVPGSYTKDGLDHIASWIEGKDPVTGQQDHPGVQLMRLVPGALAMGVVVIYGGVADAIDTAGKITKRAVGAAPEGSPLEGHKLHSARRQLQSTQRFLDAERLKTPKHDRKQLGGNR